MKLKAWAIMGQFSNDEELFLYYGTWATRKDAIEAHTENLGRIWEYCKAKWDRAIKVLVTTDEVE